MIGKSSLLFPILVCGMLIPSFNNTNLYRNNMNDGQTFILNNQKKVSKNSTDLVVEMVDLGCNGDCTLISFGKTQILVDAGGNKGSNSAIVSCLEKYMKDDKRIEYVIFTHGDGDHIANANLSEGSPFKYLQNNGISIGCWIDFDMLTDKSIDSYMNERMLRTKVQSMYYKSNSNVVKSSILDFRQLRTLFIRNNLIDYYFSSSQCTYKKRIEDNKDYKDYVEKDLFKSDNLIKTKTSNPIKQDVSSKRDLLTDTFTLYSEPDESDIFGTNNSGDTAELKILYNHYYSDFVTNGAIATSVDMNNASTCFVINYNDDQWVFNGDIQEYKSNTTSNKDERDTDVNSDNPSEAEVRKIKKHDDYKYVGGETRLLKDNIDVLKKGAVFYKASHHGSDTSNSEILMNHIKPQFVGISAAATEKTVGDKIEENDSAFKFPGQYAINSIGKWTDYIAITDRRDGTKNEWKNVSYFGDLTYTYSPKRYAKMAFSCSNGLDASILKSSWFIKNRQFPVNAFVLANDNKNIRLNSECTYIKVGHFDILLNAGAYNSNTYTSYVNKDKIFNFCNDKKIEYLILTGCNHDLYHDLIIKSDKKKGLLFDNNLRFEIIKYPLYEPSCIDSTNWSIKQIPQLINDYINDFENQTNDKEEKVRLKEISKKNFEYLKENEINIPIIDCLEKNSKLFSIDLSILGDNTSTFGTKDMGLVALFNIDAPFSTSGKASSSYSYFYAGGTADDKLKSQIGKTISLNPHSRTLPLQTTQIPFSGYVSLNSQEYENNLYTKSLIQKCGMINVFFNGKLSMNNESDSSLISPLIKKMIAKFKDAPLYYSNLYENNEIKTVYPILNERVLLGCNQFNLNVKEPDRGIIERSVNYDYWYKTNNQNYEFSKEFYEKIFKSYKDSKNVMSISQIYQLTKALSY